MALSSEYFEQYRGKCHDPVFIAYLVSFDKWKEPQGGVRQSLAHELLNIAQAKGLTEKSELKAGTLRNIAESINATQRQVFSVWLQHAAMLLAHKNQIPLNERVAAASAKVLVRDYQPDKGAEVSIHGLIIHMETTLARTFDNSFHEVIKQVVEHQRYQNIVS